MADHQMNSIHLEMPRREAFRRARSVLFGACGDQTRLAVNQIDSLGGPAGSRTILEQLEKGTNPLPNDLNCGLVDQGSVYPLKVGINTVGRMSDNDVVIEDPHVSRRHCAIVVHAGNGYELHDVASKNGTYLNGTRINGPSPLNSGDEIRMCDRQLIFVTRPDLQKVAAQMANRAPTLAK
jgi:pSer/pThr/pTyr-binding forkhead associated (FHA) protein